MKVRMDGSLKTLFFKPKIPLNKTERDLWLKGIHLLMFFFFFCSLVIDRGNFEFIFESSGKHMNGRVVQLIGYFRYGGIAGREHLLCQKKFFICDIGRNIFPCYFFKKS